MKVTFTFCSIIQLILLYCTVSLQNIMVDLRFLAQPWYMDKWSCCFYLSHSHSHSRTRSCSRTQSRTHSRTWQDGLCGSVWMMNMCHMLHVCGRDGEELFHLTVGWGALLCLTDRIAWLPQIWLCMAHIWMHCTLNLLSDSVEAPAG